MSTKDELATQPAAEWTERNDSTPWWDKFPWWAVVLFAIWAFVLQKILSGENYDLAWDRIYPGLWLTIKATIYTFLLSTFLGIVFGLGRMLKVDPRDPAIFKILKIIGRTISRTYIETIRGIPMLPLIFTVALVLTPDISKALGYPNSVSFFMRAVIALSMIYAAYIAEIIRSGVQSVNQGEIEAARSLGMNPGQTTRNIVLPQALRNVIPPLGNDFIAILKDTSLLSLVGVLELTQRAKQFTSTSFKIREGYLVLAFIYLSLTIVLSLLLQQIEIYMAKDRKGAR